MRKLIYISLIIFVVANTAVGQDFYRVEQLNLPTKGYDELAPFPYKDGIIFMLARPASSPKNITTESGKPMPDLYYVERKGERKWGSPELLSSSLKSAYLDGPATISEDAGLICFSRMYMGIDRGNDNSNTGLFLADLVDDNWINIREFDHNDPAYSLTTPYLTSDGKTLYFAADLPDTRGKFDIYVSRYVNGSWSNPQNLGDMINSTENDLFPFLHISGKLYFSSQGHGSRGDYDIYFSDNFMNEWLQARPLDKFNSRYDDYSLVMSDDYTDGFFTRRGGSWDIYRFYTDYPKIEDPQEIRRNRWKYRLKENSLDTIDYSVFEYEWVINDTLRIPGHEIIFAFPKAGDYYLSFNVHNKLTDTTLYDVGSLYIPIRKIEQPEFVCKDTVALNEIVQFDASETYLPNFSIDKYYWDFGDGMKGEGRTTTHTFTSPGIRDVVLTVKERARNNPETKSVIREIIVLPGN